MSFFLYVITSSFLIFLFVRNGGIEFQKLLLVNDWFSVDFAKYCFIAAFVRFVHLFFVYVRPTRFTLDGHLLHLHLILDLVIIALLSSFVIKGARFPRISFCFSEYSCLKLTKKCLLSYHN